jgi:hypothetical protein
MSVLDAKGKPHRVEFMGERDIQVSLDGDFDENTIE